MTITSLQKKARPRYWRAYIINLTNTNNATFWPVPGPGTTSHEVETQVQSVSVFCSHVNFWKRLNVLAKEPLSVKYRKYSNFNTKYCNKVLQMAQSAESLLMYAWSNVVVLPRLPYRTNVIAPSSSAYAPFFCSSAIFFRYLLYQTNL